MTHTVEITSLAHGGEGIGRIDGQVCFVPFALPGDVAEVAILKHTKGVLRGELRAIETASPHRIPGVTPPGHAMWLHFAYPAQADWKQRIVAEQLARIGKIEVAPGWVEDAGLRTGYRTRAVYHGDGERLGFHAPGTHTIIDTPACPLNHAKMNAALTRLRTVHPKGAITVTVNPEGDDVLVWTRSASRALRRAFEYVDTPRDREGRHGFFFDGVPVINGAFAQASLLLNRLLVRTVHRLAGGEPGRTIDLYCGSGNLSLALAEHHPVAGLDHHAAAVDAAQQVGPGDYRTGDEDAMAAALTQNPWDTVILDPPRQGAKALVPALNKCSAQQLVYVSCDPATLARDAGALTGAGWRMDQLTLVDLFPHTPHVESVCRLMR